MTQSPARRVFKDLAGNVNHLLITILVGLDAVRDGNASLGPTFSTSWNPRDPVRSANRAEAFALRALLAWLVDALDAYVISLNRKPFLLQNENDRNSVDSLGNSVSARAQWLAKRYALHGSPEYALTVLAITWRNRLVHFAADNELDQPVEAVLRASAQYIHDSYRGLDVEVLLADFAAGVTPKFKEVASLVGAVHGLVERVDAIVIDELDLALYAREAIAIYVAEDPMRRSQNIWGKDSERKTKSIRQLIFESGIGEVESSSAGILDEQLITELAALRPKEALAALGRVSSRIAERE